ncbi:cysteine hydrolase [Candidatus Gottesmanbacteria bacterium]|nr:cysteine hydrolase [Candidatus Gottesmanbacteria bacterium]
MRPRKSDKVFEITQQDMLIKHQAFLDWIENWKEKLESIRFADLSKNPAKIAIISVDMIVGFTHEGNLASPRIKGVIPNVVGLFQKAYDYGVRNFVLLQDTHHEEAREFSTYPKHAVRGSKESETIPELKNLSFSDLFKVVEKNSIHPVHGTSFRRWFRDHEGVETFIVVGDCTDLCVYQTAMHLKIWADAHQTKRKVVVPENCVETYDLSVETAKKIGVIPHDGDFLHKTFLYHMKLNGIEIVKKII